MCMYETFILKARQTLRFLLYKEPELYCSETINAYCLWNEKNYGIKKFSYDQQLLF